MPLFNFGQLNLSIKAKIYKKNLMTEFHEVEAPKLRPSKFTNCGGPLCCDFAIF